MAAGCDLCQSRLWIRDDGDDDERNQRWLFSIESHVLVHDKNTAHFFTESISTTNQLPNIEAACVGIYTVLRVHSVELMKQTKYDSFSNVESFHRSISVGLISHRIEVSISIQTNTSQLVRRLILRVQHWCDILPLDI